MEQTHQFELKEEEGQKKSKKEVRIAYAVVFDFVLMVFSLFQISKIKDDVRVLLPSRIFVVQSICLWDVI